MSEETNCTGMARFARNISGHIMLRNELNEELANQITCFRTGLTLAKVKAGYEFYVAMCNPSVDLKAVAAKIVATGTGVEDKDDDQHDKAA
ncbi:hypothetical protein PQR66_18310 [Paraburkholderia agricolaris]|uniref:Uncharacterized protein n=1 Tax=Paraburkholderia agricolaris TaxID=2152888 RepID=A0ABW8ZPZ6_9BURK